MKRFRRSNAWPWLAEWRPPSTPRVPTAEQEGETGRGVQVPPARLSCLLSCCWCDVSRPRLPSVGRPAHCLPAEPGRGGGGLARLPSLPQGASLATHRPPASPVAFLRSAAPRPLHPSTSPGQSGLTWPSSCLSLRGACSGWQSFYLLSGQFFSPPPPPTCSRLGLTSWL